MPLKNAVHASLAPPNLWPPVEDEDHSIPDTGTWGEAGFDEDIIQNPTCDIRGAFQEALSGSLEFKGNFYFNRTYHDAPNPSISLDRLGSLGLPLSTRDANLLKSHCRQAPFGQGERTFVNTSVRDTWEMDGCEVTFENPAWQTFMGRVVQEVCSALGVNIEKSKPQCELYKLLLYEKGSHFLPHVDTEKADGMFATIVVVLPSKFSGGAAHLSHGGLSTVIDCSKDSLNQTTVLSWYTDVTHEIKPITSGHRLALSFNLIHTTPSVRPTISVDNSIVANLRHILLSWKQNDDADPLRIIYLLQHKYAQEGLRGAALKGVDAHKLALLNMLTQQHGFTIGLASVECHVEGVANDMGGYDSYGHCGGLSMAQVYEQEMTITNLVDLDGYPLADDVSFEDDDEGMIPHNLQLIVEGGVADEQEYEGYQGNYGGSLKRWYRRTVLVLWPDGHFGEVIYGNIEEALEEMASAATGQPARGEPAQINYFLSAVRDGRLVATEVAQRICGVAAGWGDFDLWKEAFETCEADSEISVLGSDGLETAVVELGLSKLESVLETFLADDTDEDDRYELLRDMRRWRIGGEQAAFKIWLEGQALSFLEQLDASSPNEAKMYVDLAIEYGGAMFLHEATFPLFDETGGNPKFFLSLSRLAFTKQARLVQMEGHSVILQDLITNSLDRAISNTKYYPKPSQYPPSGVKRQIQSHIEACFDTKNKALVWSVISKLIDTKGVDNKMAHQRAVSVLLPLVEYLSGLLNSRSGSVEPLAGVGRLCRAAITMYLGGCGNVEPTTEVIEWLLEAVVLCRDSKILVDVLVPKLRLLEWKLGTFEQLILQLWERQEDISGSATSFSTAITELAKLMIACISPSNPMVMTIKALDLCYLTSNEAQAQDILERGLDRERLTDVAYLGTTLIPFVGTLRQFMITKRIPVTAQPYAEIFKLIITSWLSNAVGPKPAELAVTAMQNTDCHCELCAKVARFFAAATHQSYVLDRIGIHDREHMELQLEKYASTVSTWTTMNTSPHDLTISKSQKLIEAQTWTSRIDIATRTVSKISDNEKDLKAVFGSKYGEVMKQLYGEDATNAITAATGRQTLPPVYGPVGASRTRSKRVLSDSNRNDVASSSGLPPGNAAKRRKVATQ